MISAGRTPLKPGPGPASAAGSTLVQQIPALVEAHLEVPPAGLVALAQSVTGGCCPDEMVFLVDQRADPIEHVVIHGTHTSLRWS